MNCKNQLIEQLITDPDYDICPTGLIISKKGKINRSVGHIDIKSGYLCFGYKYNRIQIHKIIYRKFIGLLDEELEINHIDGNKLNNHYKNLEQLTNKENIEHAIVNHLFVCGENSPLAKLTENQVRQIKQDLLSGYSVPQISKLYGLNKNTVRGIKLGRSWKHI